MTATGALELWEAGLSLTPAARDLLLLHAAGHSDADHWSVGRRDVALFSTYCSTAGDLEGLSQCPTCLTTVDVDLGAIGLVEPPEPSPIVVEASGYHVQARAPTAGDLAGLRPEATTDDNRRSLLSASVVRAEHDGVAVAATDLPDDVVTAIETALERADPDAELTIDLTCPDCGTTWSDQVDPGSFAWASVEVAARRLATDVHTLARTYGWSEREILEMSSFRRHLYLSAAES